MRAALGLSILVGFVVALVLAGCTGGLDADQARICRTLLPALNPDDASLRLMRVAPDQRPNALRVDYIVTRRGVARARHVVCLFAASGLARDKARLIGVATERGPLPDANFYFLKRFYLEDETAPPADPAGISAAIEAGLWARPLAYALQQMVAALPAASVYGLLAAAYALVFGLVGRINLAFGQFAALGGAAAIIAIAATLAAGITAPVAGLLAGLIAATFAASLHGYLSGRVLAGPFGARAGQASLIATVGLSLALSEYLRLAQGSAIRWLPPLWNEPVGLLRAGGFTVTTTPAALAVTGVAIASALALITGMASSRFGRRWRAFADDPAAAALIGVDGRRLLDTTFALACGLAGLGGFIMTAFYGGLGFADGFALGLKALVAAVLGGIGSVPGAMLGGLIVGFGEAAWSATLPIESRDIAIYSLLALVLIFRPQGLLGRAEETRGVRLER